MSEASEAVFYRRAIRRIYINLAWISAAGAAAAWWKAGWLWAVGFLIGAIASTLNFRWLHQLADSLGASEHRPRRRLGFWLAIRYLLFGAVGYVIVKYFKVNLLAALVGLFVAVAAVLVEILYELIYART